MIPPDIEQNPDIMLKVVHDRWPSLKWVDRHMVAFILAAGLEPEFQKYNYTQADRAAMIKLIIGCKPSK